MDGQGEGGEKMWRPVGSVVFGHIWAHEENRGRRLRRVARWVGWQVWQRVVRRPLVVRMHGSTRLVCRPHDTVSSGAIYYGLYDPAEMRFLLAWLDAGDTFVDIGANAAPYSLLAASIEDVHVVAFEPGETTRERARANLRLNGVESRVKVVPTALSDAEGTGWMDARRMATKRLVDRAADSDGKFEEVPMTTLDAYDALHHLDRVSLMKIDVEGHEMAVLRGAQALVERCRPALIVEINEPVDALVAQLAGLGYRPVSYSAVTGLSERAFPEGRGGNLIAVPDLDEARRRLGNHLGTDEDRPLASPR